MRGKAFGAPTEAGAGEPAGPPPLAPTPSWHMGNLGPSPQSTEAIVSSSESSTSTASAGSASQVV